MNSKLTLIKRAALLLLLSTLNSQLPTCAQGTAFTYQGRLSDGGNPAHGTYDFRFQLASDPLGNNYIGSAVLTNGVPVSDGLFTASLNFGATPFNGSNYWLEVDVRTNGGGGYSALAPLQALTPVPYALYAMTPAGPAGPQGPDGAQGPSGASPFGLAGTNVFYLDGWVGIGKTNPATALDVNGTVSAANFSGNGAGLTGLNGGAIANGSITGVQLASGSVGNAQLAANAVRAANIANAAVGSAQVANGAVVKSVNNLRDDVTLAAGANVTIAPSGNTLTIGASGINPWQTSGSNIFYNDGRVGIGLSAPTARFEVNASTLGDGVKLRGNAPGYSLSDAAGIPRASLGYASSAGLYSTDALAGDSVLRADTGNLLLQNGIFSSGLALNNNQVGIGTPTPRAKLDVRGDIRLGPTGQYRAVSAEDNLRIVMGVIREDGRILSGVGFLPTHTSTGRYTITFTPPFLFTPVVTATVRFTFPGIHHPSTIQIDDVTENFVSFAIDNQPFSDAADFPFHFIAIGRR